MKGIKERKPQERNLRKRKGNENWGRGKEKGEKTKKVKKWGGRAGRRKMTMKGIASEGEARKATNEKVANEKEGERKGKMGKG